MRGRRGTADADDYLYVPPSLLPLSRNRLGQLAAVRFPTGAGLGDLTSQFLLQLAHNVDHYSPAEAARLSSAALEVLATRLAHELDIRGWGTPEGPQGTRRSLRSRRSSSGTWVIPGCHGP